MNAWGPQALPLFFVVTHLLLALLCRMELRSPFILLRGTGRLVRFIPMLRTSPAVLEMYPEPEAEERK